MVAGTTWICCTRQTRGTAVIGVGFLDNVTALLDWVVMEEDRVEIGETGKACMYGTETGGIEGFDGEAFGLEEDNTL